MARLRTRSFLPLVTRTYATAITLPTISKQNTYDIVIIGAGNAGLALAATLLSKKALLANARVLLVEGGKLDKVREWTGTGDYENRVSSLTAENVEFLKSIGAWQHIEASRSCPVREMVVWTSNGSQSSQIHFPASTSPMAYMTENTNLQRALLRRITEAGQGKIEIVEQSRVQEMVMGEGARSVNLRLGDDHWVRGGVVVGADGPNSPVRAFSQIESFGHAYPTHGVVATLHHSPITNHTAYQRFLPTGPLAFLPMSATSSTMVWSTRPDLAAAYKAAGAESLRHLVNLGLYASEDEFTKLNEALLHQGLSSELIQAESERVMSNLSAKDIKTLPPPVESVSAKSIASFPLKLSHAESYIGDRTVLVGDAAHTTHPLAGQGLNMGLADVRSLADTWENTKKVGGDLGAYTAMLPYSRARYPANHLLLSTTDKLHHLFGTRMPIVNWARSVGMDVLNELGPVKKALMERAGATSKSPAQGKIYESGANALDGWKTVKMVSSLVKSGGVQLFQSTAKRFLEKTISPPNQMTKRTYTTTPRLLAPKPPPLYKPGPPQLDRKEQAEFEALVKAAQSNVTLADAREQGQTGNVIPGKEGVRHPDARKVILAEFEGERNPHTGEVGGPKRDPFLAGDGDWQYSGRVTDF